MAISFKLLNVTEEFIKAKKKSSSIVREELEKTALKLKRNLQDVTPVDTGLARDSWSVEPYKDFVRVKNSVDYIDRLNEGSSQQAPAYFIEKTCLKYGTPLGAITEKSD